MLTDSALKFLRRYASKSQTGRGLQQKRLRQSEPCSGKVWQARCDSASRQSPVMPPGAVTDAGNWCHCGSTTGRSCKSRTIEANSSRNLPTFANAPGSQPCASTIHSSPFIWCVEFYCALPHSGQNFAARPIDLPQLLQNFVADAAAPAAPATPAACAELPPPPGAALPPPPPPEVSPPG